MKRIVVVALGAVLLAACASSREQVAFETYQETLPPERPSDPEPSVPLVALGQNPGLPDYVNVALSRNRVHTASPRQSPCPERLPPRDLRRP